MSQAMLTKGTEPNPPPAASGLPKTTELIKVKVDGKEFAAPKTMPDPLSGKPLPTTMIQACAIARVDVPHYCYHPRLPVAGNCRMCRPSGRTASPS
jgi:hypothetical protein